MDMSQTCIAPTQPSYSEKDAAHPRFRDYLNYRSAMSRQLVAGDSFKRWLDSTERHENGFATVFEVTNPEAALALGWYKNVFGPGNKLLRRNGPFTTQLEAEMTT